MYEIMVGLISATYWFVRRCLNTIMFRLVLRSAIPTRDLRFV